MHAKEIATNDFIQMLKDGEKLFKSIFVEDYSFTLNNYNLEEVVFQESFININFSNCSFKGASFIDCNLKYISFENCDLTNCKISECSVESLQIKNCNVDKIIFGTNYGYGMTILPTDSERMIL